MTEEQFDALREWVEATAKLRAYVSGVSSNPRLANVETYEYLSNDQGACEIAAHRLLVTEDK